MATIKTGEVFYRDVDGNLWIAESFQDEDGKVTTQDTLVESANNGASE